MTTHYLAITDGFDPDEYDFYDINSDDGGTLPVDNLFLLTFFANLDGAEITKLQNCCDITLEMERLSQYMETVSEQITSSFGESVANVVTLELRNSRFQEEEKNFTTDEARKILNTSIDSAVTFAKFYCFVLSDITNDDIDTQIKKARLLVSHHPDIRVIPLAALCKRTNKIAYCNAYYVSKLLDFFTLMAVLTVNGDKPVKRCRNCDKYFIPAAKRDEIYCMGCRDVSYDKKIREDEILSSYRRIYKTQSARKKRNSHRPQIDEKFEQWKSMAIVKRNKCKDGFITLTEMEESISSQTWLEGIV